MALFNRGKNITMGWEMLLILCMQGTPALFSPHVILEQLGETSGAIQTLQEAAAAFSKH